MPDTGLSLQGIGPALGALGAVQHQLPGPPHGTMPSLRQSEVVAHCLVVAEAMLHCMCFSIVLCRHASRQRRHWGGKPATGPTRLSGCGCVPHTGWFFFKLFRKTMCIFRFRCGILSSGRGSRGRLARFLDVCPSVCVSSVGGKGA